MESHISYTASVAMQIGRQHHHRKYVLMSPDSLFSPRTRRRSFIAKAVRYKPFFLTLRSGRYPWEIRKRVVEWRPHSKRTVTCQCPWLREMNRLVDSM